MSKLKIAFIFGKKYAYWSEKEIVSNTSTIKEIILMMNVNETFSVGEL